MNRKPYMTKSDKEWINGYFAGYEAAKRLEQDNKELSDIDKAVLPAQATMSQGFTTGSTVLPVPDY